MRIHTRTDDHQDIMRDQNRATFATLALLIASVTQAWMAGLALSASSSLFSLQGRPWPGLPAMLTAGLLLYLAKGTHQHDINKAMAGAAFLALLALPAAIYKLPWLGLLYIGSALVAWHGARALRDTYHQIQRASQIAPLHAYTGTMVAILYKIMEADGHNDQRERQLIRRVCTDAGVGGYEQTLMLRQAQQESRQDTQALIDACLAAAKIAEIHAPRQQLLGLVQELIECDGVVVPEEAQLLQEISDALGAPKRQTVNYLKRVNRELASPSPQLARQLLNVMPEANQLAISRAYDALARTIQPPPSQDPIASSGLAEPEVQEPDYTQARMDALRRAYQTLVS